MSILFTSILLVGVVKGQPTNLMSLSQLTNSQLTTNQLALKNSYQSRPSVASVQLINLASPTLLQQSIEIVVQLPGGSTAYTFSAKTLEATSSGDFYWYGDMIETSDCSREIFEDDCISGLLSIIGHDGDVFGEMRIDTNSFQLANLGEGLNALVKLNNPNGDICTNSTPLYPNSQAAINVGGVNDRDICPVVRMLILYTQEALEDFPDIQNIGVQSHANTKQALKNSKVSNLDVQLVGVELLPGFSASGQFRDDKVMILAASSTARQLRAAHLADLVVILTPSVYDDFYGAVFAFGDTPAQSDSAFAFVEAEFSNAPGYTFVHEFGHLFGARHQREEDCYADHDNSGLAEAHAYHWRTGCACLLWDNYREYETVVGACGVKYKILNYSNPEVRYKKRKTGKEGTNNNAKIIGDATCRISEYVISHDLSVTISDPNPSPAPAFCPGNTVLLYGTLNGDLPPYAYHWRYKLGNGVWITYIPLGPQNEFLFTIPANYWGMIYVELTVTNGTEQATTSTWVYSDYVQCPHFNPPTVDSRNSNSKMNTGLICAPNPASDLIRVYLPNYDSGVVDIIITSALGKSCFSTKIPLGVEPTNQFEIALPKLPNGHYLLTVRKDGTAPRIGKITVIK